MKENIVEEAKKRKPSAGAAGAAESAGGEERDREATSSETLSDLEKSQRVSEKTTADAPPAPAPDGQLDDPRGGSDPAGPM